MSRQRFVKSAQSKTCASAEDEAAGPLASVGEAQEKAEEEGRQEMEGVKCREECSGSCRGCEALDREGLRRRPSLMSAWRANGMSVAAAWEKPIMPTVVGRSSRSQRAVSASYRRQASQASGESGEKREDGAGQAGARIR